MQSSSRIPTIGLLVLCFALGGCGENGTSQVSGRIVLDGQPLANAQVQLLPREDAGLIAHSAETDSSGDFTIKGDRNNPVKPGAYLVVVNKLAMKEGAANQPSGGMGAMVNAVPPLYQSRGHTPLKVEVQPGANTLTPFELTSTRKPR